MVGLVGVRSVGVTANRRPLTNAAPIVCRPSSGVNSLLRSTALGAVVRDSVPGAQAFSCPIAFRRTRNVEGGRRHAARG